MLAQYHTSFSELWDKLVAEGGWQHIIPPPHKSTHAQIKPKRIYCRMEPPSTLPFARIWVMTNGCCGNQSHLLSNLHAFWLLCSHLIKDAMASKWKATIQSRPICSSFCSNFHIVLQRWSTLVRCTITSI